MQVYCFHLMPWAYLAEELFSVAQNRLGDLSQHAL